MSYDFSTIYTISIIILFFSVLLIFAFFIKRKSNSIKKIINNKKKINIVEYLQVRGGITTIIFSINDEEFFYVGHKSGSGTLVQINKPNNDSSIKNNSTLNDPKIVENKINKKIISKNKPLENVNISDLLALHKKG